MAKGAPPTPFSQTCVFRDHASATTPDRKVKCQSRKYLQQMLNILQVISSLCQLKCTLQVENAPNYYQSSVVLSKPCVAS